MADHAEPAASRPDGRRAVRRLAVARFASTGGSQAAQIALAYTIFELTDSAAWVSAALVASAGIVGLVGPLSGRLSDRFDRRRVMVIAEVGGAIGWLAVLLVDTPLGLVATALFATAANAPFRAAASASVPNLVAPERLPWANGTMATAVNASLVVGPLAGGALVGSFGPRSVFALNVVSFLVSALVIARTPGSFSERDEAVVEGPTARWRDLVADRRRRRLFTVTALSFGAFGITLVADLPLVDHFGGGAVGYALLTTLWGLGAVTGSLVAGRLPERYEHRSLVLGTTAMAIGLGSISVMPSLAAAIAVGTIGGIGSGVAFTPWFSLLQRCTPDAERGTAFAMAETFEQSSFIAGMVVAGVVVGPLGPQATYLLPGGLLLLATAVSLRITPTPRQTAGMHLAQLNVARLRAPMDDPLIDDFRDNLAPVNALAEASPGYVWRLQDDTGDATSIKPFGDELEIVNLTVWESIDALADFTYRTGHLDFLRRRRDFFEAPSQPILCLWWIPEGKIPTVDEAIERLTHLRTHGPTPTAFTFRHRFDPGDDVAQPGSDRDTCPA